MEKLRNRLSTIHANILSDLAATLHDPSFIAAHRTDAKDFSHKRVLTFPVLVAFLLCAWKGGLQTLLDELFESLTGQAEPSPPKVPCPKPGGN